MNLDKAMAAVGERLRENAPGPELTEQVRQVLLGLLQRDGDDHAYLAAWLRTEFGGRPDPAGALYQGLLSRAVRVENGRVVVEKERKGHRATGAYYTDDAIIRYMVARAQYYMPNASSVVDPACGSGAFLGGVRKEFAAAPLRLVGADVDPTALALCRCAVPEAELLQADSLLDELPGGFDLCLGNPPYISSGLRGAAPHDVSYHAVLRDRYPLTAQYKVNTYPLFIERGLSLLREGGVLGFIVPDSFLAGRYFTGLRRLLLQHTLLELVLVCHDFWEHGRVGHSVILFVRKGAPAGAHKVGVSVCPTPAELSGITPLLLPVTELAGGPLQRFSVVTDGPTRALVKAMDSAGGARPVDDFLRTYSGLIARNGQTSFLRSANPELSGPWARLLRSGKEIDRYQLHWAGEEVCLRPDLIKSGGHLPFYQSPKLLMRQTSDSLRAVYDDGGLYCLNNIHLLVPRVAEVNLRAMLGLLNSDPVNRYYRAMTMETGRLYAQVDLDIVGAIPTPPLGAELAGALERLVRHRENATSGEVARCEQAINTLVMRLYGID